MLQRMRELAVQSANDTYDDADRTAIADEVGQLEEEITRIATNTEWNGMKILNGDITKNIQVGIENETTSAIEINFQDMTAAGLDVAGLDLSTHTASQGVLDLVDTAIATVDSFRSDMGAKMNRLNYAADNMTNVSMNTSASRSRIQDTDYAQATTELARSQIIQQAATAMLAQANQAPSAVLSLLQ